MTDRQKYDYMELYRIEQRVMNENGKVYYDWHKGWLKKKYKTMQSCLQALDAFKKANLFYTVNGAKKTYQYRPIHFYE